MALNAKLVKERKGWVITVQIDGAVYYFVSGLDHVVDPGSSTAKSAYASDLLPLLRKFYSAHPNEVIAIHQIDTVGYDPDNYPQPKKR